MNNWQLLVDGVVRVMGATPGLATLSPVSSDAISQAAVIETGKTRYFVKHSDATRLAMLEAEADGLTAIRATKTVRAPAPLGTGIAAGRAFLVVEYLALVPMTDTSQEALGCALAALHRVTGDRFGWHRDNTIGPTPQRNTSCSDWADFWCRHRLGVLLDRAKTMTPSRRLIVTGENLLRELSTLFGGYRPCASLLHGDLWAGNAAETTDGTSVVFDPAVYYGDREADVAMTELFGGFGDRFYDAYREAWPLDPGYRVRRDLYNLYHVLNHALLFGGSYWSQSERLIERLRAEIR